MRRFAHAGLLLLLAAGTVCAQDAADLTVKGQVLNVGGKPLAGVTVKVWEARSVSGDVGLKFFTETTTDKEGCFSFDRARRDNDWLEIVARADGLALGFASWYAPLDKGLTIRLVEPTAFTGTVLDEEDKPIGGAEVRAELTLRDPRSDEGGQRIYMLHSEGAPDVLAVKTDDAGKFAVAGISPECDVHFIVHAVDLADRRRVDGGRPGATGRGGCARPAGDTVAHLEPRYEAEITEHVAHGACGNRQYDRHDGEDERSRPSQIRCRGRSGSRGAPRRGDLGLVDVLRLISPDDATRA